MSNDKMREAFEKIQKLASKIDGPEAVAIEDLAEAALAQQPESKPAVWIDPQQLAQAMDELALLTPVELWTMPNNGKVPLYRSQPAAQVPEGWINCKDRKPGYPITVLGAYESDDEGIPCLDVGEVCLFPDGKWYGIGIFYKGKKDPEFAPEICVKKVHLWKPLPQPPKLDGAEDVTAHSIAEKNEHEHLHETIALLTKQLNKAEGELRAAQVPEIDAQGILEIAKSYYNANLNGSDGIVGDDAVVRFASALLSFATAPSIAEPEEWRKAIVALTNAEAHYRKMHDLYGDDHLKTGRAWDLLRRAGDKARKLLATQNHQEGRDD